MNNEKNQALSAGRPKTNTRTPVAFRLEDESYLELSRRAKRVGVRQHELARHYVVEVLSQKEERNALRDAVSALRQQVWDVRKDIAVTAQALLTSARTLNAKQAREWTQENLLPD
jgi:hypothetical protein